MNYLDETRVGIWGWGYGGFVTAMVLGAQQPVYKCGISVSPITDWLYYSKYNFKFSNSHVNFKIPAFRVVSVKLNWHNQSRFHEISPEWKIKLFHFFKCFE